MLYSNRSAALLRLDKIAKALADAQQAIRLKPEWDKAWTRRGGQGGAGLSDGSLIVAIALSQCCPT